MVSCQSSEGRRAWVNWRRPGELGGICVYAHQPNEAITDEIRLESPALKLATFKVGETNRGRKVGELFLKAAFQYAARNHLEHIFIHGDVDKHHFLFEMLDDFGFERVGSHPGSGGRDAVYLKPHPCEAPNVDVPPFDYLRRFFPHFRCDPTVAKYIVPIRPEYHSILFPDYVSLVDRQSKLFPIETSAGNAIKMAYLSKAPTKSMMPGDIVLFYRSGDERALTSIGVVESYDTLADVESIISRVKRRTVYSLTDIQKMASKPIRVMLFRFVRHLQTPLFLNQLIAADILVDKPQSITKISHDKFERVLTLGD